MAKFTMEQVRKWNAGAGEGWRLDLQALAVWNEKVLVFNGEENEKGEFYRLTLKYREETEGEGWRAKATGRQIPTVDIDRMAPTGTDSGMYRVVLVYSESLADLAKTKKMFSHLQKISKTLDTDEYIKRAIEKDTGKGYNDLSDFENETEEPETTAQEPETIEESEVLTDEETTVCEGMKFVDADNKVFEITKLDSMSVEFNNGERALYDFGTSRTLKAVLDALGNGAKYQNAQTKKGSLAENLCKTTENEKSENADTGSIAENTEESKEKVENAPTTAPTFEELARSFVAGKTVKTQRKAEPKGEPQEQEFTKNGKIGTLHTEKEIKGKKYIIDAADLAENSDTRYEVVIMDENGDFAKEYHTDDRAEAR